MQLLLVLAAYLLVTAVLKDTLGLSQRICCGLAIGEQMHTFAFLILPSAVCYTESAAGEAEFIQGAMHLNICCVLGPATSRLQMRSLLVRVMKIHMSLALLLSCTLLDCA